MNSEIIFQQIEHEDSNAVISFSNGTTFKINKLMEQLNIFFKDSVLYKLSEKMTQVGIGTPPNHQGTWNKSVDAEILEPQSGEWKKGKVRMRVILEFCPDEPEEAEIEPIQQHANSLDDIRQIIAK
jgi:hypothetical protein